MPMFGSSLTMPMPTAPSPAQPAGMLGGRFEDPLRALAVTLGPAVMAQALNMPQLAGIGPGILGMASQSRQAERDRALRERALKLEESKAARERAMAESVSRMFAPAGTAVPSAVSPEAAIEAATAAGAGPGPTRVAAGMLGEPEATAAPSGGMFAGLTPDERRMGAMMAGMGDPMAALRFGSQQAFAREKASAEAGRKGPIGPFGGSGMEAQVLNTLSTADPSSFEYRAAYETYTQPKTTVDPVSGSITTVSPDTSWLSPPTWSAAGAPSATAIPVAAAAPETRAAETPTTRRAGSAIVTTTPGRPTRPSQPQLQAGGFASRIAGANQLLEGLEQEGTSLWQTVVGDLPMGNYALTPEYQQFRQARDDFINAQLRRESGAAISAAEYDNAAKQYFAQPGDSPQVIEQKRKNRENVLRSLEREAGPSYERPTVAGPATTLPSTTEELRSMSDDEVLKALGIR